VLLEQKGDLTGAHQAWESAVALDDEEYSELAKQELKEADQR
jgi:hypothetical protein